MNNNELDRAIVALRQHRSGASTRAESTEARVVALIREQQQVRRRWRWLVPLAAICAASSAWAATHLEFAKSMLSGGSTDASAPSAIPRYQRTVSAHPTSVDSADPPENDAAAPLPSAATPVDTAKLAVPTPVLVPRGSALPSTLPSSSSTAEVSQRTAPRPSYQIFRDAKRLQYGRRDYAAALTAWEQYLAVEPNGALALEARFNRGLCLAAMGRAADAERALAPFATGEYGQYRLQEARAVLNRLGITPANATHHSTASTQPR
ncbi:MAG TPA: hypothetical protein VKP30_16420 [Polyangiaceae bacterium]|nr:hypothetical protein [Polyangiaceae bacterium]